MSTWQLTLPRKIQALASIIAITASVFMMAVPQTAKAYFTGNMTGTITSPNGLPLENAKVTVSPEPGWTVGYTNWVTSNAQGVYYVNNFASDLYGGVLYSVVVEPPQGYTYEPIVLHDIPLNAGLVTRDFQFTSPLASPVLSVTSPTRSPLLTWPAVPGAENYMVYRNGQNLGFADGLSFSDSVAPEGLVQYAVTAFKNGAESPSSNIVDVTVDKTGALPIGIPAWTANPKPVAATSTVSFTVTDNLTPVAAAEYYFGETDPGEGNGTAMVLNNSTNGGLSKTASATFGTNLTPGVYQVNFRAQDQVGNWNGVLIDFLAVYDPAGPKDVAASKQAVPSVENGDVLPGLEPGENAKAKLAFDVRFDATGTAVDSASELSMEYSTGKACNGQNPVNCHVTRFMATSFTWLVVGGANSSAGTFVGNGSLEIDGQASQNPFRVEAIDGGRVTPATTDSAVLYIFAPGVNPTNATAGEALYVLHMDAGGNWVKIQ